MGSKKKTSATNVTALRIGSRVRCTDDGVEGRITWANAVSVKIKWDDGEQVTWKRADLANKPIEFLDAEQELAEGPAAAQAATEQAAPEQPAALEPTTEAPVAEPTAQGEEPKEVTTEPLVERPAPEPQAAPADSSTEPTPAPAKPKRQPKSPAQPKEKKVSALDAAARVLAEEGRPMTCQEMIDAMAAKSYWTSPGGATPAATLYSAILREMTAKGAAARFIKTDRGKFALRTTV
jgi:hypothetical protein